MICKPCLEAGEWNASGVQMIAPASLDQARIEHAKCKGDTWCDCQHVVGRTARAGREPK